MHETKPYCVQRFSGMQCATTNRATMVKMNFACCITAVVLCVFPPLPPTKKRFKFFNHYIKMICIFESSNNNKMTHAQQTLDFLSWTLPSKLTTLESTERAYEAINEAISEHGELKMFVNRKNQVMKKLMDLRIEKRKPAAQ